MTAREASGAAFAESILRRRLRRTPWQRQARRGPKAQASASGAIDTTAAESREQTLSAAEAAAYPHARSCWHTCDRITIAFIVYWGNGRYVEDIGTFGFLIVEGVNVSVLTPPPNHTDPVRAVLSPAVARRAAAKPRGPP